MLPLPALVWDDSVTPMDAMIIPTPEASATTVRRRRYRDGYRPDDERVSAIIRANENNDYVALLQAIKDRTVWSDGCWIWFGQIKPDGSAWVSLRVRAVRVRRLVAEAYIGGRLDSCDKIWSTCSQKGCVNPEHLQIRIFNA
jgi:hypothetical protein